MFVRIVLFYLKFGIEPAVKRIGEFKSFGDSYSRDSMSAAQREVSTNLLETASGFRSGLLARSSGKSVAEVEALYDSDVSAADAWALFFFFKSCFFLFQWGVHMKRSRTEFISQTLMFFSRCFFFYHVCFQWGR